jgi:hypothetical protein
MKKLHALTMSRLRIAQRCLVAATDLDPELTIDPYWQKAMSSTALLLAKGDAKPSRTKIKAFKTMNAAVH